MLNSFPPTPAPPSASPLWMGVPALVLVPGPEASAHPHGRALMTYAAMRTGGRRAWTTGSPPPALSETWSAWRPAFPGIRARFNSFALCTERHRAAIEAAYRGMWQDFCAV